MNGSGTSYADSLITIHTDVNLTINFRQLSGFIRSIYEIKLIYEIINHPSCSMTVGQPNYK